jgi:hypothetical protein
LRVIFPFVRLEFTSSLGPAPGRYPVGGAPDALLIRLVGAPVASGFLRRTRRARAAEPPRELAVLHVTWVRSSTPLSDGRDFMFALRREDEREALIGEAFGALNRAILAYAVAAWDPYAREVSRFDPRAVHAGIGTGEQLDRGDWTDAVDCPTPAARHPRLDERLRPDAAVAEALASGTTPPGGTLHLLRALLDTRMGRAASAAAELSLGLELLGDPRAEEARSLAPDAVADLARAMLGDTESPSR